MWLRTSDNAEDYVNADADIFCHFDVSWRPGKYILECLKIIDAYGIKKNVRYDEKTTALKCHSNPFRKSDGSQNTNHIIHYMYAYIEI